MTVQVAGIEEQVSIIALANVLLERAASVRHSLHRQSLLDKGATS